MLRWILRELAELRCDIFHDGALQLVGSPGFYDELQYWCKKCKRFKTQPSQADSAW